MKLFEMEGFLRGKCLPGDMKVNETNAEYLVRKFAELEQKLAESQREFRAADATIENLQMQLNAEREVKLALAAKNAGMKAAELDEIEVINRGGQAYCVKDGMSVNPIYARGWNDYRAKSLSVETPATDAFLAEVRAQGVEAFLRGGQLPYQIATVLADYDNVDDATLQTVIWSGQPPEPDGDVWHLEYVSRGNAIVRAVLKELRKGVQS
ncbi:hypothetical protein ABR28_09375 [Enterobacter hormaechei subsp. hoffmannii]|uniref:hypothetical protein n=1 Tax=Enterobacter hormaechei TaxID=158836 RepID=UPI000643732F|nr:hypothetical protein [Enterobacter hormaechei]KLR24335.1 hypothetical protein ABR28_09375 [Enterobacter hormaechei subsp. hoffmannii]